MIQAGIIAGIGNKSENKNIIYPEFDANINNYLVGRNTILEGLELKGNTLTAGTCILAGYRGTLEQNINLDTTAYIYGEFIISFGTDIDSFNIVTSDTPLPYETNVSSINSAGTYYLLLYISGEKNSELVADKKYPTKANYSDETTTLLSTGTIQEGVTGTTLPVNSHTNRPKEIATTQYVYNQIEEQIGYGEITVTLQSLTLNLRRRSKFVIGKLTGGGTTDNSIRYLTLTLPEGYIPIEPIKLYYHEYSSIDYDTAKYERYDYVFEFAAGQQSATSTLVGGSGDFSATSLTNVEYPVGYQCQ